MFYIKCSSSKLLFSLLVSALKNSCKGEQDARLLGFSASPLSRVSTNYRASRQYHPTRLQSPLGLALKSIEETASWILQGAAPPDDLAAALCR
jgi:hypothetical protein